MRGGPAWPLPGQPRVTVGQLLRLVVHGHGGGTPVGMAVLTVSAVAQHLRPFISVPNFSPLLCSALPMFDANCPFPLQPPPAPLRDRREPKALSSLPWDSLGPSQFPLAVPPAVPPAPGHRSISEEPGMQQGSSPGCHAPPWGGHRARLCQRRGCPCRAAGPVPPRVLASAGTGTGLRGWAVQGGQGQT